MITPTIDAHERRSVAVFDISCAYLHTDNDEKVTMVLKGVLAELMMKVDPLVYRKHVTVNSRGKSLLCVNIHKALYGFLRSSLLFLQKLERDSEVLGFKLKPYYSFVANKMVNGSHMKVVWNVDDLKLSHVNNY